MCVQQISALVLDKNVVVSLLLVLLFVQGERYAHTEKRMHDQTGNMKESKQVEERNSVLILLLFCLSKGIGSWFRLCSYIYK